MEEPEMDEKIINLHKNFVLHKKEVNKNEVFLKNEVSHENESLQKNNVVHKIDELKVNKISSQNSDENSIENEKKLGNIESLNVPIKKSTYKSRKNKPKNFHCTLCPKSFLFSVHLKIHQRVHTKEKPFTCEICDKSFTQLGGLNMHKKKHLSEKEYSCSLCEKKFWTKSEMQVHFRTHTGEKNYSCDICYKTFGRVNQLNRHRILHAKNGPYICPLCQMVFQYEKNFLKHEKDHVEQKKFLCEVCNEDFTTEHKLSVHKKKHKPIETFPCKFCDFKFDNAKDYAQHEGYHTGLKPFLCIICGKCYPKKHDLKIHTTIHTGEKPADCRICHRTFRTKSNRNSHELLHFREAKEPKYSCSTCDLKFGLKKEFLRHMRIHAKDQELANKGASVLAALSEKIIQKLEPRDKNDQKVTIGNKIEEKPEQHVDKIEQKELDQSSSTLKVVNFGVLGKNIINEISSKNTFFEQSRAIEERMRLEGAYFLEQLGLNLGINRARVPQNDLRIPRCIIEDAKIRIFDNSPRGEKAQKNNCEAKNIPDKN